MKKHKKQPTALDNVIHRDVVSEMKESYINYSLASLVRALPNIVDGLIPVSRRLMWVLYQHERKLLKSARIVGDVIGKYHPHGDTSAYGTLVNMSGPFKNHPLAEGQGNWGSIDGDSAAAMRYTEAKISEYALDVYMGDEIIALNMQDNYDGSLKEPEVLCPKIPTILVHGISMGTAVGYQATVPQHNLDEVCSEVIHYLKRGKIAKYIQGPDFRVPNSVILNTTGVDNGRQTGVGKIYTLPKMKIELNKNKVPFLVIQGTSGEMNKATMIEDLAYRAGLLSNPKKPQVTNKISNIRDLSSKDDIRVEVTFKRGSTEADIKETVQVILTSCLGSTNYQLRMMKASFNKDDSKTAGILPIETGFSGVIKTWYEYRVQVLLKYFKIKIENIEKRLKLLRYMEIFLKNYKKLSLIIMDNDYPSILIHMKSYGIDKEGVDYILDSPFRRAQNKGEKIREELDKLEKELINYQNYSLNVNNYILKEVVEIQKKYRKPRNTAIIKVEGSVKDFIHKTANDIKIEHNYQII